MKRIFCLFILLLALIATVGTPSALADDRPSYPFPDKLGSGLTRHHIIPWEQIVESKPAKALLNKKNDQNGKAIETFLSNIKGIDKANLGESKTVDKLAEDIREKKKDAIETYRSLLAWLPGNLVIGPSNRKNDPGDKFDKVAYECLKNLNRQKYEKIEKKLGIEKNKKFKDTKVTEELLKQLAKNAATDASGKKKGQCWRNRNRV